MARLDRFMPIKEVAQIGAAIGRDFSYELIAGIAPMSQAALDSALSQLVDSGLAFRRGTPPDAIYTFKHALVQDAAYDSLLKSRRQELHGKIAKVIDDRFPTTRDTEPEVLAHHLTAAGHSEGAVTLWQKAGELALKRMALTEAISHLNRGLESIAETPESATRDASELGARTLLGTAWMAHGGWFHPKIEETLEPAWKLANALALHDAQVFILWARGLHALTQGRVEDSLTHSALALRVARDSGNEGITLIVHTLAVVCDFWSGDIVSARSHCDQIMKKYDRERHKHLVQITNHDPRVISELYESHYLWMLGYPDQAIKASEEAERIARENGHPFDLGFALTLGAWAYMYRNEARLFGEKLDEAEKLGAEHSIPFFSQCENHYVRGFTFLHANRPQDALSQFELGLKIRDSVGGYIALPPVHCGYAQSAAILGDLGRALEIIDRALEQIHRPGWGERAHLAEVLRIKGWILSLAGDVEGAQRHFLSSLDHARAQQARGWELRAATSLATLWKSQGKCQEATELLAPVYGWFTEGFDTKDLKDARALLLELDS